MVGQTEQNATQLEATANKYKDKRVIDRASQARKRASEISPAPAKWNSQRKETLKQIYDDPLQGL